MSDKIFKLRDIHVDEKNRTRLIFWGEKLTNENISISAKIDGYDAEVKLYSKDEGIFKKLIESSEQSVNLVGEIEIPKKIINKKHQIVFDIW